MNKNKNKNEHSSHKSCQSIVTGDFTFGDPKNAFATKLNRCLLALQLRKAALATLLLDMAAG